MELDAALTPEIVEILAHCAFVTYKNPGQSNLAMKSDIGPETSSLRQAFISEEHDQDEHNQEDEDNDDNFFPRAAFIIKEEPNNDNDFFPRTPVIIEDSDFQRRRNELFDALKANGREFFTVEPFYKDDINDPQIAGYIIATEKETIVTFRGTIVDRNTTDRYQEVKADISCWSDKMEFGSDSETKTVVEVHAGFKSQYDQCKTSMKKKMDDCQSRMKKKIALHRLETPREEAEKLAADLLNKQPIFFTGHSLGGALAQFAALDYACQKENEEKKVLCCTMAVPSVFKTPDFYNSKLGNQTVSFFNTNDSVVTTSKWLYNRKEIGHYFWSTSKAEKSHEEQAYKEVISEFIKIMSQKKEEKKEAENPYEKTSSQTLIERLRRASSLRSSMSASKKYGGELKPPHTQLTSQAPCSSNSPAKPQEAPADIQEQERKTSSPS